MSGSAIRIGWYGVRLCHSSAGLMLSHEVTLPALALKIGQTEIPSRKFPSVVNNAGSNTVFADTASFPDILKIRVPWSSVGSCGRKQFWGTGYSF